MSHAAITGQSWEKAKKGLIYASARAYFGLKGCKEEKLRRFALQYRKTVTKSPRLTGLVAGWRLVLLLPLADDETVVYHSCGCCSFVQFSIAHVMLNL